MDATNKIMVAVAFTEYSAELLGYAAGIADSIGAEMIVANIINSRDVEAVGTIAAIQGGRIRVVRSGMIKIKTD